MIGRELKSRENHLLDVLDFTGVVLGGVRGGERVSREDDPVLEVDVTLGQAVSSRDRLVQLRLQVCPGVTGRGVQGVWLRSPARRHSLGGEECIKVHHPLPVFVMHLVRVAVQPHHKLVVRVRFLPHGMDCLDHRLGCKAVGIAVEGGKVELVAAGVLDGRDNQVPGCCPVLDHGAQHVLRHVLDRVRLEHFRAREDERVLVALAIGDGRYERVAISKVLVLHEFFLECRRCLLEENKVRAVVG
mmetsp:Transcript_35942/g.73881  ORF Transcript_35942/g.73881 Transcript_35942/m.73881 type:complete len:244 (-) Transcript_35942:896-1627(-)